MEIFRRSPLDKGRLETCKSWYEFEYTVKQNPFAADLWMLLSSYEPDIHDNPVARTAFHQLLDIPEIATIRKACAGDPALSAAVTVMLKQFAKEAGDAVNEAEQEHQQEQGEPQPKPQPGESEDTDGEPQPGDGEPQPGDGDGEGQDGEPQPEDGKGELSPQTEQKLKDALEQAAKRNLGGTGGAEQRIENMTAGFSLLGDSSPSLRDRMEVAEGSIGNLSEILKLVGTLRQTVSETGRYIRSASPDARLAKPGYGGGLRALATLDNSEIADLTTPGVQETMFWQRWKNRRTRVTHSWAKVPAAAGPIILMGDESSSMPSQEAKFPDTDPNLTPADWLVALALAISEQCEAEKRPFVYQAWASSIIETRRFQSQPHSGLAPKDRLALATDHAGGGTQLPVAIIHGINEAMKLSRGRNVKADVLVITDGSWYLNPNMREQIIRRLEETKIKVHLFLVCVDADPSKIEPGLWTSVVSVKDLLRSTVAVGKIMA